MGMHNLYDWGLPNQAQHLAKFRDNETLYNIAKGLWSDLHSASMYLLVTAIVIAIILACYYYYGYNKLPGRKYKVLKWFIWMVITFVITFIITIFLSNVMISSSIKWQGGFIIKIALINSLYSAISYLTSSFIICNLPVPTNAYRFLKIGK